MNLQNVRDLIFEPAFQLLPHMRSPAAEAMLLAIGMQESRFEHRVQLIGNHRHWWESLKGPARSAWQFERIGIRGVLEHPASRPHALAVLNALRYPEQVWLIHKASAHNDLLAACFARLLLWTDPRPLPGPMHASADLAWAYYLRNWRPGKPHRQTWDHFWQLAILTVQPEAVP